MNAELSEIMKRRRRKSAETEEVLDTPPPPSATAHTAPSQQQQQQHQQHQSQPQSQQPLNKRNEAVASMKLKTPSLKKKGAFQTGRGGGTTTTVAGGAASMVVDNNNNNNIHNNGGGKRNSSSGSSSSQRLPRREDSGLLNHGGEAGAAGGVGEHDSSSEEEEEGDVDDYRQNSLAEGAGLLMEDTDGTPASSNMFAFQTEFDHHEDQDYVIEETPYEPPTFDVSLVEPAPHHPEDLSPFENPPIRPPPEIYLQSNVVLSGYLCKPVTNPLTGNVVVVRQKGKQMVVHEMDLKTGTEVACTPLLDPELQRNFLTTYSMSAIGVNRVLQLAIGLHKPQGQCRVRLCALIEYIALSPSGKTQTQTSLVIWQWGYGTHKPVALHQPLLSPPNHADFTYNPSSLQTADGLVFLAGYAQRKGPCVFVARPTVKDTWAANFLGDTLSSITCLAVTRGPARKDKLLAIAMQDGFLGVWTYEQAIDRQKGKEESKVILPLCRLEANKYIMMQDQTRVAGDDSLGKISMDEVHFCTDLEWKTPDSSYSSLLYLAAAYTHGIAIFHVSLPLLMDTTPPDKLSEVSSLSDKRTGGLTRPIPKPTHKTSMNQTVGLRPICAAQWSLPMDSSSISWVDLGPQVPPTIAVWLEEEEVSAMCMLGVIELPSAQIQKDVIRPFRVLAEHFMTFMGGLLSSSAMGGILCYGNGSIEALTPAVNIDGSFFASLRYPVASMPPGLDSAGYVSLPDTARDEDGILHVYSVTHCERKLTPNMASMLPNTTRLDWTSPIHRHWLCRSFVGDNKDGHEALDDVNVTGGSYANVICELTAGDGLVPHRIVRCKGSSLCAVLFRHLISNNVGICSDPSVVILVDVNTRSVIDQREGRDCVFFPKDEEGRERALVLGRDGTMVYMLTRKAASTATITPKPPPPPPPEEKDDNGGVMMELKEEKSSKMPASQFNEGVLNRPLLGFEVDEEDYVESRRMLAVSSGTETGLIVVGARVSDGQVCLVAGNRLEFRDESDLRHLIPNVRDAILWLRPGEEVVNLVELPQYEEGRHCVAVATQNRIMLVSSGRLNIRAEIPIKLSSSSLASIGSHTVCFISSDNKVRYLCCLDGKFSNGIIATLPVPRFGHAPYSLMAVRPDRFLYSQYHTGSRLVEQGDQPSSFWLPTSITRPAMLLEQMVANALCEADNPGESTILLRAVIERFGRKVGSFPHGDDEGIGVSGIGLTQQVMDLLSSYGLKHPSSWLLTGSTRFERCSHSRIMPLWMPMPAKSVASLNSDANLHLIANGDQYFSDYVKSPDLHDPSTLPRPSDPSSVFSRELAKKAMAKGDIAGAMKLLDIVGTDASDSAILHMTLAMQTDKKADVIPVLEALSGYKDDGRSTSHSGTASAIAALALDLRRRQQKGEIKVVDGEFGRSSAELRKRWMRQLAPSVQRSVRAHRVRHRLIAEAAIKKAVTKQEDVLEPDNKWNSPCSESKHIWVEGTFKDKENILLLDRIEEWLGRKRPAVLGKEGAEIALDNGKMKLENILKSANTDDDPDYGGGSDKEIQNNGGWIERIGEGFADEDNLSAYFRMSEGADEDSVWRTEGLADLSKYQNKMKFIGQDIIKLQETTSSVDEGEKGKVQLLYDIVFDEPRDDSPVGALIEVARGGSCDVGILHGPINSPIRDARKRCTLEFWYHLPQAEYVHEEIILCRRSVASGDDLSKLCVASVRECALWELVVLPTGELEFRTNGGTVLNSTEGGDEKDFSGGDMMGDFGGGEDESVAEHQGTPGEVSWGRTDGSGGWNHVCLIFTSKYQEELTECTVSLMMKGARVASTTARIVPPGLEGDALDDSAEIDAVMSKTVLLFGLNPVGNLRFTEVRVWCCERKEDDIKMNMFFNLRAAEMKRKLKVKIKAKKTDDKGTSAKLMQGKGRLAPPPSGGNRTKGLLRAPPRSRKERPGEPKVAVRPGSLAPPGEKDTPMRSSKQEQSQQAFDLFDSAFPALTQPQPQADPVLASAWDSLFSSNSTSQKQRAKKQGMQDFGDTFMSPNQTEERDLYKTSRPLSRQVRGSAAAALVRGPPATRHFGGNRGGLARAVPSDRSETARFGVGNIAICGAEKTVVYKHDRSPPGKTYPIGASGAIISDEMDNEGSEYLCCFLAKDKRMVVFELTTKTVVVELQMTTKLNYWRYLPPQAHGHTLVFMLITPVGGFHWMPLDESPRPRQVWKRGSELSSKKIVAYEEGGSNGMAGLEARSTVALILVSTASSGTPLEAWLMPVCGNSRGLCVSSNILGAALFRPYQLAADAFLPLMVTADTLNDKDIIIEVQPLVESKAGNLGVGVALSCQVIEQQGVRKVNLQPPTLAMGTWPEVFLCCHENLIIAAVRKKGLLVAYEFNDGDLQAIREEFLHHYIVDAAIRAGMERGQAEVVLLLADVDNPRDGRVVSMVVEFKPQSR